MSNKEELLKDILLKMRYDSSKTLYENIQEQGMMQNGLLTGTIASSPQPKKKDELIEWRDNYPNQCKYKDKALMPKPVGNLSVKESLIKGYCLYPSPNGSLWVPASSEVDFWDMQRLKKLIDKKINERDSGESFFTGMTDQNIQTVVMGLFPMGTIAEFNVGDRLVSGAMTRKSVAEPTVSDYSYKGMYYFVPNSTGVVEPYIQPKREDERSDWDYFIDKYGIWAQLGTAALFAVISMATGGVGGILLLATEIAVEGALGYAIAQREWEKGNEAAGWFELIFGLTPFLKVSKLLKGVSSAQVSSIIQKMKSANLPLNATPDELMTFYKTLSETEQEIFSKMLKDVTDEVTEGQMKQALGKKLIDDLYRTVKKNPDLFKDIKWWQKVVWKEGLINGAVLVSQLVYESIYNEPLSEEEKEKIKGVYTVIDSSLEEKLGNQIIYELASKPENIKSLKDNIDVIAPKVAKELITTKDSAILSNVIKKRNAKRLERIMAEEAGIKLDLKVTPETSETENNDTTQTKTLSVIEMRTQGWKLSKTSAMQKGKCQEDSLESKEVNGRIYYRCKQ